MSNPFNSCSLLFTVVPVTSVGPAPTPESESESEHWHFRGRKKGVDSGQPESTPESVPTPGKSGKYSKTNRTNSSPYPENIQVQTPVFGIGLSFG